MPCRRSARTDWHARRRLTGTDQVPTPWELLPQQNQTILAGGNRESVPQESAADTVRSAGRCRAQPTWSQCGEALRRLESTSCAMLAELHTDVKSVAYGSIAVRQVDRVLGQRYRKLVRGET